MQSQVVAAVDQGTTSSRCLLFNRDGHAVSSHQLEHRQIYPRPGWVEHDAEEIWGRTGEVIRGAMEKANLSPSAVAAVGVTNQRETTVVWDRKTGRPYANAIVWQDTRTDGIVLELAREGGIDRVSRRTVPLWLSFLDLTPHECTPRSSLRRSMPSWMD